MKFGKGTFDISKKKRSFFFYQLTKDEKKVFLGLPQWREEKWRGNFYKKDIKSNDFLREYSKLLDCVEVSSTFYTEVSARQVLAWKESVPNEFFFLPKWPKQITHNQMLCFQRKQIKDFVDKMLLFDEKLGTTILQLPPNFSRDYNRELYYFLLSLPKDFQVSLEFRHPSWFEKGRVYKKLEEYLALNKIGMVCSDTPARQDVFHMSFTGCNHIIRYVSDEVDETDKVRLTNWKNLLSNKICGKVFFTLHRPVNDTTPKMISYFSPEKGKLIQENLEDPQRSLFL